MKPVTLWYKYDSSNKVFEFNHLDESGWSDQNCPEPFDSCYLNQVAWKKARWQKDFKILTDENKIIDLDAWESSPYFSQNWKGGINK